MTTAQGSIVGFPLYITSLMIISSVRTKEAALKHLFDLNDLANIDSKNKTFALIFDI